MSSHYVIQSLRSNRKIEFIFDDAEPNYVVIKIGSSSVQISSLDVAILFSNIAPFLANAIEKEINDNE